MAKRRAKQPPPPPARKRKRIPAKGRQSAAVRLTAAERERAVWEGRAKGETFEAIGEKLGISRQTAHKAWRRALARVEVDAPTVEAMRHQQNATIEAMLAGLCKGRKSALTGSPKHVAAATRLLQRQARLNGLDQPLKLHATGTLTMADLMARVAEADAEEGSA